MRALRHFVVEIPKTHNDKLKLGDKEIYIDTRFNEFDHRICYGTVVSPPELFDTGVSKGDTIFFHHHVTMNKSLSLGDNKYIVIYDHEHPQGSHAIAYRNSEGELKMLSGWVFVTPRLEIPTEEVTESGIIYDLGIKEVEDRTALVFMPNKELMDQGVKVGDVIGFDKDSDYKMKLDDDSIVYRMRVSDIAYVLPD